MGRNLTPTPPAIAAGMVAITPLHFDLTYHAGVQALADHDLDRLMREPIEHEQ